MTDMIERVAKVFADAGLDGCETTDLGGNLRACVGKCLCRTTARAAIQATHEPTDAMLWAGYQADAGTEKTFEDFMSLCPGWRADQTAIWRAMITAALVQP